MFTLNEMNVRKNISLKKLIFLFILSFAAVGGYFSQNLGNPTQRGFVKEVFAEDCVRPKPWECGDNGVTADGCHCRGGWIPPQPPPPCTPGGTSCGGCSVSCGGGTQTCSDGCSSWGQSCNTQSCCNANSWGSWSACSATCGGGTQSRTNACGTGQSQACNTQSCCDANAWGGWSACTATCGGGTQSRTNACGTGQSQACNTQACPTPTLIPTLTPTPVPGTCPATKGNGDADCNGVVDGIDYSIWLNSQCHPGAGQSCADTRADFNGDGNVDDTDYTIWQSHFSSQ